MILRSVLTYLLSSIFMLFSVATADPVLGAHKNLRGALQPDSSYVSGKPVIYFSVSKYALAEIGAMLAYSTYNSHGYPVIFYDEDSLAKLPTDFQRWIFSHELAHFRLDHFDAQNEIYQKSMGFVGAQYSHEQAADCAAVNMLKQDYFLTYEQVIEIAQTAQSVFHGSSFQRIPTETHSGYAHQFGYDEPEVRAAKIIACYESE